MAFPLSDDEHRAIKSRIESQDELVVAAAVRVGARIVMVERPGRHGDCINWLSGLGIGRGANNECGFLTNTGRIEGREEAGALVLANDQGSPGGTPVTNPRMGLFSEDMWNEDDEDFGPINPATIFASPAPDTDRGEG